MPVLYPLPAFLNEVMTRERYARWLHHKAAAHVKRDRKRVTWPVTVSAYKTAIHAAVEASGGLDFYTGERLRWELISTYDNAESKAGRSVYKAGFALLPSVDHVSGEGDGYDFVICGWRTNDSKHDMSLADFVVLCRRVVAHHGDAFPV